MNLNSIGLFLSQAGGGGAAFAPSWLFPGATAGFTADPYQQAQSFTTSAGSTLAVPGDLVGRIERIAGTLNATSADAVRPRYANYPLVGGVGSITNLTQSFSEKFDEAVWSKQRATTPDATTLIEDSTAANTHLFSRTYGMTSGAVYTWSATVEKLERNITLGANTANVLVTYNLDAGAVSASFGTVVASGVIDEGGGVYRCWFAFTATATSDSMLALLNSGTSTGSRIYDGDGTSGAKVYNVSFNAGSSPANYQTVGAGPWDVTESSYPLAYIPYWGGTAYGSFGVEEFGTASLLADVGQAWTAWGVFRSVLLQNQTLLSKANADGTNRSFLAVMNTSDQLQLRIREDATTVINGPVSDGRFHFWACRWDGTNGFMWLDSSAATALNIGTGADTDGDILMSARLASPLTASMFGHNLVGMLDYALTDQQISQLYAFCKAAYGVV